MPGDVKNPLKNGHFILSNVNKNKRTKATKLIAKCVEGDLAYGITCHRF